MSNREKGIERLVKAFGIKRDEAEQIMDSVKEDNYQKIVDQIDKSITSLESFAAESKRRVREERYELRKKENSLYARGIFLISGLVFLLAGSYTNDNFYKEICRKSGIVGLIGAYPAGWVASGLTKRKDE